jgi:hypothetical protein
MKHVKPTPEELEANAQRALAEAEAMKDTSEPSTPDTEPEPVTVEPSTPDTEPEPTPSEAEPEPSKEIIKDVLQREKEKNIASAQEAQILSAKVKKTNEALEKALSVVEPTEEELQAKYQDWEMMSDFEKKMAKDSMANTKRLEALNEIVKENKDLVSWSSKVEEYVTDPEVLSKHPELEGKEDEFKLFANKPTRRNVDFEDLLPAFLFGLTKEQPKKGKMFEIGSGGDKQKPKSDKISIEQARTLRTTNYEKYKELLRAGKIEVSI